MKKRSISWRLTLSILLFVSIMFIIALSVVAWTSYNTIADEATKATKNQLYALIREIEIPLVEVEVSTFAGARIVKAVPDNDELLVKLAHSTVAQSDKVVGCAVAFADGIHHGDHWFSPYTYRDPATGEVVDKYLGSATYNYHQMQWFREPYETGKPQWSDPYYDTDGGDRLMTTYSYPVKDADGKVFAIITADIAIDWIDSMVRSIRPYANSLTSILCSNDSIIGIDDPDILETLHQETKENQQLQELHSGMKKGGDSLVQFRVGRLMNFTVFAPLRMGWSAAITCRYIDVLHSANEMLLFLLLIGIGSLLIFSVICYLAVRKLTRPISELSAAAIDMSHGNLKADLPIIHTNDEMLQLRDSFETMQHSLIDYIEELRTTTASANRMEGELSVARDIQLGMLSTDFPPNLHALLVPAKEVGGDLYDFVSPPDGSLYFAVGDVSGKGAPAALMMSITRASLRFVGSMGLELGKAVERVNNSIAEANSSGMFVTLFVGHFDPNTGLLRYCNGGHNPILILPPDGEPYLLKAKSNVALGVVTDFDYESQEITLKPGTRLLLYTDGITEAERVDHSQYGEQRLLQWASSPSVQSPEASPQNIVDSLYASVHDFTCGNVQNDDITIMCIAV